jgi:hypothetical protein
VAAVWSCAYCMPCTTRHGPGGTARRAQLAEGCARQLRGRYIFGCCGEWSKCSARFSVVVVWEGSEQVAPGPGARHAAACATVLSNNEYRCNGLRPAAGSWIGLVWESASMVLVPSWSGGRPRWAVGCGNKVLSKVADVCGVPTLGRK